ncbi:MAG: SPOR domain-containing protein [bacterium]|nr:SPOR domain-containing protein [bacterium]
MVKRIFVVSLLLIVAFAGCTKKAKTNEPIKQDQIVVVEEQPDTQQLEVIEEPIKTETNTNLSNQNEYKVQLFATYDEAKATKVRDEAAPKFTQDVYVDYVAPYYKVRIGHFTNKDDADKVRDLAKEKGYNDAFTVVP